jgi:hypothetical protein
MLFQELRYFAKFCIVKIENSYLFILILVFTTNQHHQECERFFQIWYKISPFSERKVTLLISILLILCFYATAKDL